MAFWSVAIFTAIQQVDNHVITPLVQRARVNLSPLVIILALIIGGSVAGLLGVLVAVPMTAAIKIVVGHLWRTRVLGETWGEASLHMIEFTDPPERIAGIRRRHPNQSGFCSTRRSFRRWWRGRLTTRRSQDPDSGHLDPENRAGNTRPRPIPSISMHRLWRGESVQLPVEPPHGAVGSRRVSSC